MKQLYAPWTLEGEKVVVGNHVTNLLPQGNVMVGLKGLLKIVASDRVMLRDGFQC